MSEQGVAGDGVEVNFDRLICSSLKSFVGKYMGYGEFLLEYSRM